MPRPARRPTVRRRLVLVACAVICGLFSGCTPTYNWLVGAGGPSGEDENDGISADSSGRVIVAGKFRGTAAWGSITRTSSGADDMFVARYSPQGAIQSVASFGAGADDAIFDSTTDRSDATYLSGWFGGTVDFGSCPSCDPTSAGGHDMAVVKQDAGGQTLWVRRFGSASEDGGNEIETDDAGNVYVLALSIGAFSDGRTTFPNEGLHDSYVMKLRPDGTHVWTQKIAGSGRQRVRGIELTAGGAVLVTGEAFGETKIGSDTYSIPGSQYDVFTARLDAGTGQVLRSARYGTSGVLDFGRGIAGDLAGDSRLSGTFTGSIDFGSGARVTGRTGTTGVFVTRIGADGSARWATGVTSTASIQGGENVTDAAGNVYVTGDFSGDTTWNTTSGSPIRLSSTPQRAFVAKYDPAGKLLWVSAPSVTDVRTVADELFVAPAGRLVVNGQVYGSVQYPTTARYSAASAPKDMFILSLNRG